MNDRSRPKSALGPSSATVLVLLSGLGLVMASTGLQGSLIGVRASDEGFPVVVIGAIIATYYVGFVLGSTRAPRLIADVGHIRVFAALASMVSAAVVLHAVHVTPLTWMLLRAAVGLSMAGIYIVVESWLNDLVDNDVRGRLLGLYMAVVMGGVAAGQLLLNVADPAGFELFVVASVLVSVAVVPLALTATTAPTVTRATPMGVREVLAVAPLAAAGAVVAGLAYSALVGMGAVFGSVAGLSVAQISMLIAVTVLGGVAGQWPVGRASDRRDRRRVIAATSLAVALAAGLTTLAVDTVAFLVAGCGVIGFLAMPLYSLAASHLTDWLEREDLVGASATMVLLSGAGSIAGPLLASWALSIGGAAGFLWLLAGVHALLGAYALHRLTVRPASARQQPSRYVSFVTRAGMFSSSLSGPQRRSGTLDRPRRDRRGRRPPE